MVKGIFIFMALALTVGGAATIFGGNVFRSGGGHGNNFVQPEGQANVEEEPDTLSEFEVTQFASPPALSIDLNAMYRALIHTPLGDIDIELLPELSLEAVNNFVFLAEEGFYDGLKFHHVAAGFSATAGDPACSVEAPASLCRGTGGPGYELDEEAMGDLRVGMLGMANGSQFFIALTDSDSFSDIAPFGEITSGFDVAEKLVANTPIDSIEIFVQ